MPLSQTLSVEDIRNTFATAKDLNEVSIVDLRKSVQALRESIATREPAPTAGFYKLDAGTLLYASHSVSSRQYALTVARAADRGTVVDGWQWFPSFEDACADLGYTPEEKSQEGAR